jgi:hypothetical protein
MASSSGGHNREYMDKSVENYKAAVKADPKAPPLLLQGPGPGVPLLWLPAMIPSPKNPKAEQAK